MLAEFQVSATTGKDGRAIGEVMNGADVRTESYGSVVEETRSIGFFSCLQFVNKAG